MFAYEAGPNTAWAFLPLEACSALARGPVITRDGLWEHSYWEREHQPCGCEPRGPASSIRTLP